jgi:hypothetical protein
MTNPAGSIREGGPEQPDGTFAYAQAYGEEVAGVMSHAVRQAKPVQLVPFVVSARPIAIPIENKMYRAARELGVLQRDGLAWTGDPNQFTPLKTGAEPGIDLAMETEVAYLRLGEIHIAAIPGELYPELLYNRVQPPGDPGSDFPDAPAEPAVADIFFPSEKWLILGLANDEIGYIIPKRQWDERPPYCYGRTKSQYGEINSCGPSTAPIIMNALSQRVAETAKK